MSYNLLTDQANVLKILSQKPVGIYELMPHANFWDGLGDMSDYARDFDVYHAYKKILELYPKKDGFVRKYKLLIYFTCGNVGSDRIRIKFQNKVDTAKVLEIALENVWGSTIYATSSQTKTWDDFEGFMSWNNEAHLNMKVKAPSSVKGAIHKVQLLIYDVLE